MEQVKRMLKADKWQAMSDSDGKVLGFRKALKLIVLGVCCCLFCDSSVVFIPTCVLFIKFKLIKELLVFSDLLHCFNPCFL